MPLLLRLLSCLLILPMSLGSGYGGEGVIQPRNYLSASGEYRWQVDPADRDASAGARYTLYRGNTRVRSQVHAFAMRNAVVAADGTLGGFAHVDGTGKDRDHRFVLALLRTNGEAQVLVDEPQRPSPFLHVANDPRALGLFVDETNQWLTLRIDDADIRRGLESWRRFHLKDGTVLPAVSPAELQMDNANLTRMVYAQPLPGSGLTLVQWLTSGKGTHLKIGTRFSLLDRELKSIWSLDFQDEFAQLSRETSAALQRRLAESGSVLNLESTGFSLWQASSRQRVDLSIAEDESAPHGWRVVEQKRTPHAGLLAAQTTESRQSPPARALEFMGHVELASGGTQGSSLGGFDDFAIDKLGRFGLLRLGGDKVGALALVAASGDLLREIPLDFVPIEHSSTAKLAWIEGERWLVTFHDRKRSQAFLVDMDSGRTQSLERLDAPPVVALSADGNGGFVALTTQFDSPSRDSTLIAFGAEGRRRWQIEDGHGDEAKIFSAEDVTVTADGTVVVLENVSKMLKRFDRNGRSLGSSDLESLWGREPTYPTGIEADAGGGVIVFDFSGSPAIVRMAADGGVREEWTPALGGGQRFDIRGNVQAAPDGELWTGDGNALYRLDAKGQVVQTIGAGLDLDQLAEVAGMRVTADGRIYAMDSRSGAIHQFAPDGSLVQICRPAVGDYDGYASLPSMTVTDTGEIYVHRQDGKTEFLHYDADCKRLGVMTLAVDALSQDWLAQAGTGNRWVVGYEEITRVDERGTVLNRISRSHNGRWLVSPHFAAAAPDGALAVVTEAASMDLLSDAMDSRVAIFSAGGVALRDLPAPPGVINWVPIAFDGEHLGLIVASDAQAEQREAWVMDAITGETFRVANAKTMPTQAFFVRREGTAELWLYDGGRGIDRFRLH